jgi:hypothetical protein
MNTNTADTIGLTSTVARSSDLPDQNIDEAVVMANAETGDYYGVELAAGRIWQMLKSPGTVADLCEVLLKEYDIDRATCERDVLEFVNDLAREGLVKEAGSDVLSAGV